MSAAVESVSGDPPITPPELLKSFNLLKSHANKVADFILQWQSLEDHLRSTDEAIQSRIDHLRLQSKQPEPVRVEPPKSAPENLNFGGLVVHDGEALLEFMSEHLKEKEASRDVVADAIRVSAAAGRIVLEAMRRFYPSEFGRGETRGEAVSGVRRSCVVLLEEMTKVRPVIGAEVKEEAAKLAVIWKGKARSEVANALELWAFLQLVSAFGLVGEFDRDEIFNMFGSVAVRKQAPELFRSLGFADRASEFIQKLVSQNMRIEAIRFIQAFELLHKWPPMLLLKAHLKFAKKDVKISCKRGQDPLKAEDAVIDKEVASLKAVIRCIESYKLDVEPQYSPNNLRKRISQLKRQKTEKEVTQAIRIPEAQYLSGKKRTAPKVKAPPNKHHRTDLAAVRNASFRAPTTGHSIHPSYVRTIDLLESRGTEYLIPSAGMPRQAADAPHTSYGTTASTFNSRATHYQETGSYKGEGAEYAARYKGEGAEYAARYKGEGGLSAGRYGLVSSSPITQTRQSTLTGVAYELAGSSPIAHTRNTTQHMNSMAASYELGGSTTSQLSPLTKRYGASSMAINGRAVQFGSAGSPLPVRVTDATPSSYVSGDPLRMASHKDRPVTSSSGYGARTNQYQPSIYHL